MWRDIAFVLVCGLAGVLVSAVFSDSYAIWVVGPIATVLAELLTRTPKAERKVGRAAWASIARCTLATALLGSGFAGLFWFMGVAVSVSGGPTGSRWPFDISGTVIFFALYFGVSVAPVLHFMRQPSSTPTNEVTRSFADQAFFPDRPIDPAVRAQAIATVYGNAFEAIRAQVPWRPRLVDDTGARRHVKPS